jgi:hypothetical protein
VWLVPAFEYCVSFAPSASFTGTATQLETCHVRFVPFIGDWRSTPLSDTGLKLQAIWRVPDATRGASATTQKHLDVHQKDVSP